MSDDHIKDLYERRQAAIKALAEKIPTAYFMAVINVDGLLIAAWAEPGSRMEMLLTSGEDPTGIVNSSMLSMGERIVSELNGGAYHFSVVRGEHGTVFNILLNDKFCLLFGVYEVASVDGTMHIMRKHWLPIFDLLRD